MDIKQLRALAAVANTGSVTRAAAVLHPGVQKRLVIEGRGWTILPAGAVAHDVAAGRMRTAVAQGRWAGAMLLQNT